MMLLHLIYYLHRSMFSTFIPQNLFSFQIKISVTVSISIPLHLIANLYLRLCGVLMYWQCLWIVNHCWNHDAITTADWIVRYIIMCQGRQHTPMPHYSIILNQSLWTCWYLLCQSWLALSGISWLLSWVLYAVLIVRYYIGWLCRVSFTVPILCFTFLQSEIIR